MSVSKKEEYKFTIEITRDLSIEMIELQIYTDSTFYLLRDVEFSHPIPFTKEAVTYGPWNINILAD